MNRIDWTIDDEVDDAKSMAESLIRAAGELRVYGRQVLRLIALHRQNCRTIKDLRTRNNYLARQVYDGECHVRAKAAPAPADEHVDSKQAGVVIGPDDAKLSWGEQVRMRNIDHVYEPETGTANDTTNCKTCGYYPAAPVHRKSAKLPHKYMNSKITNSCVVCKLPENAAVHMCRTFEPKQHSPYCAVCDKPAAAHGRMHKDEASDDKTPACTCTPWQGAHLHWCASLKLDSPSKVSTPSNAPLARRTAID